MQKNNDSNISIPVGLDFIFIAIFVGYYLLYTKLHLHPVFCIIGGIVSGSFLFFLMSLRIIGIVLQVICSAFWAVIGTSLLDYIFHFLDDPIWTWAIMIVFFLVMLGSHLAAFHSDTPSSKRRHAYQELSSDDDVITYDFPIAFSNDISAYSTKSGELTRKISVTLDNIQNAADESTRLYNQAMKILEDSEEFSSELAELQLTAHTSISYTRDRLDDLSGYQDRLANAQEPKEAEWIIGEMERCLASIQTKNQDLLKLINNVLIQNHSDSTAKQHNANFDESLFNGCHDKESLTKRYRNLMKTFHPDTGNGDVEMTQKIQHTYEELLSRMS